MPPSMKMLQARQVVLLNELWVDCHQLWQNTGQVAVSISDHLKAKLTVNQRAME
jgi:hypothetical protein